MTQSKACAACSHPERRTIDNALWGGQAPRSIIRRYAGLSRRAVTRHRDECLKARAA
ncbi:MAG: hypothetical protein WKF67_15105 [Rubrobacteraceae bacterium]